MRVRAIAAALLMTGLSAAPAFAACNNTGSFDRWLSSFKQEAVAQGISPATIASALDGVTLDQSVIKADRGQAVFAQSFLQFSDRMVAKYRLDKGAQLIKKYKATFDRIQQKYGVPAPVIVAFWGLETDFGANLGDKQTLRSLATLAYDCRRPDKFRVELMDALQLVQRGDLSPAQMRGPWAGELGQTQFLASNYLKYGVDFDGDGHINLISSVPDVLASTANYLDALGWQANQPWLQEVRVPADMPWEQADLATTHPRAQWVKWGVKATKGSLPADGMAASLILPMGKNGPAFLGYPNFRVYLEWNESLVYSLTAAYFATRLAGAPTLTRGDAPPSLSLAQGKQLQQKLAAMGYDVGKIDGIIGAGTRGAVQKVQAKLGLPADGYPTAELLARLR
ncbi:lytic murein transglycosylase [Rhodoligotrophos appendicifer]|uniref:lytic murein transglycosylase n=1 Tax=Rhodoligotrophos appendicifer TaxID=987056 RepID=UPI00118618E0|nr:lytic murein transglycosylase [Rhodoligotrophos appendicifer]